MLSAVGCPTGEQVVPGHIEQAAAVDGHETRIFTHTSSFTSA
jgi:hypothetical protein